MITIYTGKSASGKDFYMKKAIACGLNPIVTYTTRPKRAGEKDGVDYNFISEKDFEKLVKDGTIWESRVYHTTFNGEHADWYYGSPVVDASGTDYVTILDLEGVRSYITQYGPENINVILVEAADEVRHERAVLRGTFSEEEWTRRQNDDKIKFSYPAVMQLKELYGKTIQIINNSGIKPLFSSL